jgi:hypothetical protein
MNALARAVGFRFFERDMRGRFELRMSWAEITGGLGLGVGLINWDEDRDWSLHLHVGWPNIYLKLPFMPRRSTRDQMMDQWGFSFERDCIHLNWGEHTKIVHMPWALDWHRTSILMKDGQWWHETRRKPAPQVGVGRDGWVSHSDLPRWSKTLPYRYLLRSGEWQERTATIGVEEREWRRRAWRWLPMFRKISRSIHVEFSDEVGERSGSWKGGTIGCGYELLRDETPEECLRRMERDRKF